MKLAKLEVAFGKRIIPCSHSLSIGLSVEHLAGILGWRVKIFNFSLIMVLSGSAIRGRTWPEVEWPEAEPILFDPVSDNIDPGNKVYWTSSFYHKGMKREN